VISHYNGWVYELFFEKELEFWPGDGERIMEAQDLAFEEIEYGLIRISTGERSLLISPRGGSISNSK
jgi:hypothetical protein